MGLSWLTCVYIFKASMIWLIKQLSKSKHDYSNAILYISKLNCLIIVVVATFRYFQQTYSTTGVGETVISRTACETEESHIVLYCMFPNFQLNSQLSFKNFKWKWNLKMANWLIEVINCNHQFSSGFFYTAKFKPSVFLKGYRDLETPFKILELSH